MRKIILGITAAVSFSGAANALPIINGSFESGPPVNPIGFTTLPGGSTAINGWVVEGDSVDFIGDYWQHQDGNRSVDLAGSGAGGISQTFTATAGALYRVIFYIARNPEGGFDPRLGSVNVNGALTGISYNNTSSTNVNMGWQKRTFTFNGLGGVNGNKITFSSDTVSNNQFFGPALDNVSISAVPEPTTWAMLILGFGFVGSAMRRRKTNVRVAYA